MSVQLGRLYYGYVATLAVNNRNSAGTHGTNVSRFPKTIVATDTQPDCYDHYKNYAHFFPKCLRLITCPIA